MTSTGSSLRVLSYNIHKGFSPARRRFTLRQMKQAIQLVHADLVFLQEVVGEHTRHKRQVREWPLGSQFEYLADSVWKHFAYGKNAVYEEGHHGNALLSKYPIVEWSNLDVSQHRYERRGILHAVIHVPRLDLYVHCLCLHFGLFLRGRRKQLQLLCKRVNLSVPSGVPLIIAGDFNDWSRRASAVLADEVGVHEVFEHRSGAHARTFPSRFPLLPLDRIYCRGLRPLDLQIMLGPPWNKLSDHAALYAELALPERKR